MSKKKTTEEFIAQARKKHNDMYDYAETTYVSGQHKIKYICGIHGMQEQYPHNHIRYGCCSCGRSYDTERFIIKAREKHGDKYDYSKAIYFHSKTNVIIKCKKHGDFVLSAGKHLEGRGCQTCSAETSQNERWLFALITKCYPELKVISNDRTTIKPLELDISIPAEEIYVEWNGYFWHSQGRTIINDIKKKQLLGDKLLQIIDSTEGPDKKFVIKMFKEKVRPFIENRLTNNKLLYGPPILDFNYMGTTQSSLRDPS